MPRQGLGRGTSPAVEDYVKGLYHLGGTSVSVSTTDLAAWLHISPAGTSHMLRQLAQLGLVEHTPYYGVRLSQDGTKLALEMIRHHRLAEQFLVEILGYQLHEVHADAERLEHAMSEMLEARMAAKLGNPRADPHGHPIPTVNGDLPPADERSLASVPVDIVARIERVNDRDPEKLRYLTTIGLIPGAKVVILSQGPFNEPLVVQVGAKERVISRELAQELTVHIDTDPV